MRAATWTTESTRRLALSDLAEPERPAGHSTIRVEACGLCGTDLHLYRGNLTPVPGSVPGHELAGVVTASDTFAPGTLVAIEPVIGCRQCAPCRGGTPHHCTSLQVLGISAPGGLQEFLVVPDANVYPVADGVSAEVATLAEPLAVAVRGVHLADLNFGSRVLVLGSGAIGLLTLLLARRTATEVAITARYPQQREMALAFGATQVFEPGSKELRAWAKEARPDVVLETVGGESNTLTEAIFSVRPGGIIVALGIFSMRPEIPAFRLVNEGIQLRGAVMYGRVGESSEFGAAVALLPELQDQLKKLIVTPFPLAQVNEAFEAAADKQRGTLKVTVAPNQ